MENKTGPNPQTSKLDTLLQSGGRPLSRKTQSMALLLEFKRRRKLDERVSAREYIEQFQLRSNQELAIDLLFAEYLDEHARGNSEVEHKLTKVYPEFAKELQKQIQFHRALEGLDQGSPSDTDPDSGLPNSKGATVFLGSLGSELTNPSIANQDFLRAPKIPGLEFVRPLGRGGMGIVFLAKQPDLNRFVAVKLLIGGSMASKSQRARFRAEAQAAASLRHPNIVLIDDVGEHEGQPYLVMEYVEGGSLDDYLKTHSFKPREAAAVVRILARAVHEAHLNGIVHRDLKPGNVLLGKQGRDSHPGATNGLPLVTVSESLGSEAGGGSCSPILKIADFGLAKMLDQGSHPNGLPLTMSGDLLGTPSFMAPEQASGVNIGPWTDVYSLGAILYQLLAGRPPFLQDNAWDTLQQVVNELPPPLSRNLPRDLRTICEKCLRKEPLQRYSSASELAADLQNFLEDRPISAQPVTWMQRSLRWCRRNQIVASLGGSVLISLLALVVTLLWSRTRLVETLNQTALAQLNERRSYQRSLENLWDATVSEASALQTSGRIGQKWKSLQKVREAQELLGSVNNTDQRLARLRDAAIAALALGDVEHYQNWLGKTWEYGNYSVDRNFNRLAQISSDGKIYVSEGFGKTPLCNWPAQDARELASSPDGKYLAVAGDDCYVVNLENQNERIPITNCSAGWWKFTPASDKLVGFDADGLLIFDLKQRSQNRISRAPTPAVPLSISPNGQLLAIANFDKIKIFDLQSLTLIQELKAPDASLLGPSLAWHPNNRYLAAAKYSGNWIHLWDIQTSSVIRRYPVTADAFHLAFSADGRNLFSVATWGGSREIFDLETERSILRLPPRSVGFQVSKEGDVLILEHHESSKRIYRFDPSTVLTTCETRFGPSTQRHGMALSPDGLWLVVGSAEGLEILDTFGENPTRSMPIGNLSFDQLAIIPAGTLWGNLGNGWLRWQIGETTIRAPDIVTAGDGASIAVSPDGNWGLNSSGNEVELQNFSNPSQGRTLGNQLDVRNACFSPDSRYVATGSWNQPGGVAVWRVADGSLIKQFSPARECVAKFSSDGRWLFTSPNGGEIWDTRSWSKWHSLKLEEQMGTGFGFAFSSDGKWCIHTDGPGRLVIVDLATKETLAVLTDPQQEVYHQLIVSADQRYVFGLTKGRTSSIKRWDLLELSTQMAALGLSFTQLHLPSAIDRARASEHKACLLTLELNKLLEDRVGDSVIDKVAKHFSRLEWETGLEILKRTHHDFATSARLTNDYAWTLVTVPREFRDAKKAVELAKQAVAREDLPGYWNTLGVALYRAGEYEKAIKPLQNSLSRSEESNTVYDLYVLAACCAELDRSKEANQYFEKAETVFRKFQEQFAPQYLTEINTFRDEARDCIEWLERAVVEQP